MEVNASDTRNKSDKSALKGIGGKLSNGIRELATNTAISTGPDGKPSRVRCAEQEAPAWRGSSCSKPCFTAPTHIRLTAHCFYKQVPCPLWPAFSSLMVFSLRTYIASTYINEIKSLNTRRPPPVVQTPASNPGLWLQVCLVMDEVDGMSGGDRGGVQDLIESIKRSRVPIVAICNDKYHQKLRSLRNHCLELEYRCVLSGRLLWQFTYVCSAANEL